MNGQVRNFFSNVKISANGANQLSRTFPYLFPVHEPVAEDTFVIKEDVFRHRKVGEEIKLLVDNLDTGGAGLLCVSK